MKPSRGMISGELAWAFIAICYAISGSGLPVLGDGYLYRVLAERDCPWLWALLLAAPAAALIIAGVRELCAHRTQRWTEADLERSTKWRGRFCLAAILGWLYMLKVLLTDFNRPSVFAVLAIGACVFMWWCYKENRRVRREIRRSCRIAAAG